VRALGEGLGPRVALVALGGYGREELCPGSDVDLMVLHAGRAARVREAAEHVFYPFWDAGFPLGHAVRTVQESTAIARDRLDAATAMLDARLVSGDGELFAAFERALAASMGKNPGAFLERLLEANRERRERHGSCSTFLEPDLKEGSGGLRDLHSMGWAARVLLGSSEVEGMVRAGLLRGREAEAVSDAGEFLIRLRTALHLQNGKRGDRVFMEHQPALAEAFGFEESVGLRAPDVLMRTLFEHARQVEHVRDAFFERARERAAGRRGAASAAPVASAGVAASPPAVESAEEALDAFARMAENGDRPEPGLLDALETAVPEAPAWTPGMRASFVRVLAAPGGRAALEAMDRADLLARLLPEWAAVRCRPQRDPYHQYTVDLHLSATVAEAARVLAGGDDDPVLLEAARAVRSSQALLLGAFLHDIGKTGEGRHVPEGVRIAARALDRMEVDEHVRGDVLFLVGEHLLLADVATRRDLSDENLVLDVAARVGTPERLAMLYILTVADARATGPHARTPWRLGLMRELLGKVQRVLERGEMGTDRAEVLKERAERVRELLAAEDADAVDRYLARLPRSYLVAVPPETAAAHFRLIAAPLGTAEVRTEVRGELDALELTVVAPDRPGLLSKVSGSLALHGLNIRSARAFTTEDGVALDLFVVEPAFGADVEEDRWRRFRSDLRRALEGRISLEYRVRQKRSHYPPPSHPVEPEVTLDNEVSDFSTVVEVSAADRIGLLFDLTRAFHELELDVHVAKVATYAGRVVDAFYVRDLYGRKVEDAEQMREIERAVLARLEDAT